MRCEVRTWLSRGLDLTCLVKSGAGQNVQQRGPPVTIKPTFCLYLDSTSISEEIQRDCLEFGELTLDLKCLIPAARWRHRRSKRATARSRHLRALIGGICGVPTACFARFTYICTSSKIVQCRTQSQLISLVNSAPLTSAMPIPLLAEGFGRGISGIPYVWTIVQVVVAIGVVTLLKSYFGGATCGSERVMHGKVVMVTV